MDKKKVLFICVHNSARSQMAEAFLKQMAGNKFEAESAGLEPGALNSLAVEVMKEIGIDISQNKTKSVFDFYKQGKQYDYVITVCDESQAAQCPVFPGAIPLPEDHGLRPWTGGAKHHRGGSGRRPTGAYSENRDHGHARGAPVCQLHWAFDDPSAFKGSLQEKLEKTRQVRDKIKQKIEEWVK